MFFLHHMLYLQQQAYLLVKYHLEPLKYSNLLLFLITFIIIV